MKRISTSIVCLSVVAILLAGCAGQGASGASADESAGASSWPITPLPTASAGLRSSDSASSDSASSDAASSDAVFVASSEAASSDRASSNAASSGRASSGASSGPVLSGPSGIAEMNVPMRYISQQDLLAAIKSSDASKLIVDLRKPEDAQSGSIPGAIFAPVNRAVDGNDYADALANITGALYDATGNEVGEGKELVLVCYAGKKYAQAATDILNALGADMDKVYTLEGGMNAWNEAKLPVETK